ncbi:hypothetical protein ACNFB1_17925 [Pseudomonas sp. NY15349]|jgi:hypothetical protein|uniref:hypothetical protein n=1 Tax=unclassified Pseudomonas TaxID=196821 RepID=UPI001F23B457|nr:MULTISPECIES: hypothetical protein [unclassified Pseudomonas]MCE5985429.1 hypothetical protein [Pseudomonas sp. LM20]UMY59755.1 hypothetical protein MKK04_16160 [Pseudomonas sp. LS.1a]
MSNLFKGPFFDYVLANDPLKSASYFKHGSNTMLYQVKNKLYRLTREGCGHNFIAEQSARLSPHVTNILHDYGPVAPSDEDDDSFYWLAEVEVLQPIPFGSKLAEDISLILAQLVEDEESQLYGEALVEFGERCLQLADHHDDYSGVLEAWETAARFAAQHEAAIDVRLDNMMVRPSTGELVLTDPICDTYFPITEVQKQKMAHIYSAIP